MRRVRYLPALLTAAVVTFVLSCLSMVLAVAVGVLIASGRVYGPSPVRALLTAWVELIRGTPLLLQLFVLYFGLAVVVELPAFHRRAHRPRAELCAPMRARFIAARSKRFHRPARRGAHAWTQRASDAHARPRSAGISPGAGADDQRFRRAAQRQLSRFA